jgi:cellobiose-specific phosphotransferase system component IIC
MERILNLLLNSLIYLPFINTTATTKKTVNARKKKKKQQKL